MDPQRWQQIDTAFQACLDLDEEERAAYLENLSRTNNDVRQSVEALFYADSAGFPFLEQFALDAAAPFLAYSPLRLEPGQRLSHYEIVGLLGKGGMGEVYAARDTILDRRIAVKVIHPSITSDASSLERFRREARTISTLNHPNILTIYELGVFEDHQFIATELVDGETIRELLSRGPIPIETALDVAIQTARALAAAHRAGVVHRDIKPENIMLRSDGYVKVLDFGLAKLAAAAGPPVSPDDGAAPDISSMLLMGTPRYMSPEQFDRATVDARTDIFSLGSVLYEMVAGRPAFEGRSRSELRSAFSGRRPERYENSELPEGLGQLLAKMMAVDPGLRYQNAETLIADLERFKANPATRPAARSSSKSSVPGRRALFIAALAICAVLIGYGSYRIWSGRAGVAGVSTHGANVPAWNLKARLSQARSDAGAAVLNGRLYVAGGWDGTRCAPFGELEQYEPETDSWLLRSSMNTARGGHGLAALNGRLYAVGGSIDCGKHIGSVEAYSPETDSWSSVAPLPKSRTGLSVAASSGRLYAIGGVSAEGNHIPNNTEYDPETDTWRERSPLREGRSLTAAVTIDGIVYLIGGSNGRESLSTVEAYDPSTDTWTAKAPMRYARYDFSAAVFNERIYVFGGNGDRRVVEVYDPGTDEWTEESEMDARLRGLAAATLGTKIFLVGGFDDAAYHAAVREFTPRHLPSLTKCKRFVARQLARMSRARMSPAGGSIDGRIYVAGGFTDTNEFVPLNESYDPAGDTWRVRSPMSIKRETSGSNTAVVKGKLYAIGGNAAGYCTAANEAYDPTSDSWATLSPMPTPRCHSSAVAYDGRIFVFGGTNTSGIHRYPILEIYDVASDKWSTGPPMPTGRHHATSVEVGGVIFVIGGFNLTLAPDALNTVEAYDTRTGVWSKKAPMSVGRGAAIAGVLRGKIVVLGGGSAGEQDLSSAEIYDPQSDSWSVLPDLDLPRAFALSLVANDTIYVFGGRTSPQPNGVTSSAEAYTLESCED